MLIAESLSFTYEKKQSRILNNANLTIQQGEIVGLTGNSGKGKTTLAKLLSGYLTPSSGTVTLDGSPLPKTGYCPVQMIFQNPEFAVNPRWTIDRIISEAGQPVPGLTRELCIETHWNNRYPHELSGGELQRIAVARALDVRTRYLIADEITTMLDGLTQAHIWNTVLSHIDKTGMGALVISHDQDLLNRICNRTVTMGALNASATGAPAPEMKQPLKKAS